MSALEQEILERIAQLDDATKLRLLEWLDLHASTDEPIEATSESLIELGATFAEKYGPNHFGSAADVLNEIREERLNDLMGNA